MRLRGTEIRKWDVDIQAFYPRETPTYRLLLPDFRKPFQNGSIEDRVKAVRNLVSAIGTDASLAAVKTDVQTFLGLLTTAMDKQGGLFTSIETATTDLETARLAAAEGMMYVYGKFVSKYYKDLKLMESYFPVDLLQRIMQVFFVATLKNNKVRFLFKRKMDIETDLLQIRSVGKNAVVGFFNNGLTTLLADGDLFVLIPPNSQDNYNPALMGYTDDKRHFHLVKKGVGTNFVTVKTI